MSNQLDTVTEFKSKIKCTIHFKNLIRFMFYIIGKRKREGDLVNSKAKL